MTKYICEGCPASESCAFYTDMCLAEYKTKECKNNHCTIKNIVDICNNYLIGCNYCPSEYCGDCEYRQSSLLARQILKLLQVKEIKG
jgi:hypothetical protein